MAGICDTANCVGRLRADTAQTARAWEGASTQLLAESKVVTTFCCSLGSINQPFFYFFFF